MSHKDLTPEEWAQRREEAEFKLGRPFVKRFPVRRTAQKSDLLMKIEQQQKEESRRRPVVTNIKKEISK